MIVTVRQAAHSRCYRRAAARSSHLYFSSLTTTPPPSNCDVVRGPSLLRTVIHRPRPSLLFLPGLRSLPFWTQWDGQVNRIAYQDPTIQQAVKHLEDNFATIRDEYQQVVGDKDAIKSDYEIDTEHKLHRGGWDWHSYMLKGSIQGHFGQYFPQTTIILQKLREENMLFEKTPFGYTFFSTLHPQSSIDAHSAPMNLRLRVHLPLIVPADEKTTSSASSVIGNDRPACGIRVGPTTRTWHTGKALVLDDSYDHEVWNDTQKKRVLLLVDLWHPDVQHREREDIMSLFQHAHEQGWWSLK